MTEKKSPSRHISIEHGALNPPLSIRGIRGIRVIRVIRGQILTELKAKRDARISRELEAA